MRITLIRAGADGTTRFDEIEIPLSDAGAIGRLSAPFPADSVIFRETGADYDYDWHPAPARQLTFDADGATVEVELADGRLVGQLLPPGPARVELQHGTEVSTTVADDLGRFALDVRVSRLPATGTSARWRLRIESDTFRLVTAWFAP